MADIFHELTVRAPKARVFDAISTPAGLNAWWTLRAEGKAQEGRAYTFDFGPGYVWKATVTKCTEPDVIAWTFVDADPNWTGTHLRLALTESAGKTIVTFAHTGWRSANRHFRVSSYCWAMYLRLLRNYTERGEVVPYEKRQQT